MSISRAKVVLQSMVSREEESAITPRITEGVTEVRSRGGPRRLRTWKGFCRGRN